MNKPGGGGVGRRGGGVVLTTKWYLAALLTVSLISTLLLADTMTRLWSRPHLNSDEVIAVRWRDQTSQHPSMQINFQNLRRSILFQPKVHNGKLGQASDLSESPFGSTKVMGSNLTADYNVVGYINDDNITMLTTGNRSSFVEEVRYQHNEAEGTRHQPDQVDGTRNHRSKTTLAGTETPRLLDDLAWIPAWHQVTPVSSNQVTSLDILYKKLLQVEHASLVATDIAVRGSPWVAKHHMPLLNSAFHKFKMKVLYQPKKGKTWTKRCNTSVVMCLNTAGRDGNCGLTETPSQPLKVNIIPELISAIMSREFICAQTNSQHQRLGAVKGKSWWYGSLLPCYSNSLLPDKMTDICRMYLGHWQISSLNLDAPGQFIPCDSVWSLNSSQRSGESLLVLLPRNLLTLDGMAPLVWQTEVLVTSLSPPRVYLHPAGIAWSSLQELVQRKHPKNTSLLDLEQLFTEWNSKNTEWNSKNAQWNSKNTMKQLQFLLLDVVRSVERRTTAGATDPRFCQKCFQQLEILLVFDSSFQPIILEVRPKQFTKQMSSISSYLLEQNILDDLAAMLASRQSTSADLLWALYDLGVTYVKDGRICDTQQVFCLEEHEIIYLLDTRREQKAAKNWIRLFPSTAHQCQIKHSPAKRGFEKDSIEKTTFEKDSIEKTTFEKDSIEKTTFEKDSIENITFEKDSIEKTTFEKDSIEKTTFEKDLIEKTTFEKDSIEKTTFEKDSIEKTTFEKDSIEKTTFEALVFLVEAYNLCPLHSQKKPGSASPIPKQNAGVSIDADMSSGPIEYCDSDNNSWPYLSAIHIDPYIQLHPEFSPLTTDYRADVSYQTTLVHIAGVSRHCRAAVRLGNQRASTDRWAVFGLGLGDNKAHILVVSTDSPEAAICNIYTLTIHREPAGLISGFDELKPDYQVCSLKQDCSLPFSTTLSCGLQNVAGVVNWAGFLQQHSNLPKCDDNDNVSGEWMVPCFSCRNESSCYWEKAVWQPLGCQEGFLATNKFMACLAGKKVLFIGDSTNRGILHYILQRLNGSLLEWDKTHSIHVYSGFNDDRTIFGFAYYPQFWRKPGVRPGLDTTLTQLLNRTSQWPYRETVLVLGGVHWLAKHHFGILEKAIKRDGDSKWTVIVKGLGAGFHQPFHGVHQLSVTQQQQLFSHNQAVLAMAHNLGYFVVDTFSMTMSRYKEFLPGKCSCHFHQVSSAQIPALEKWNSADKNPTEMFYIKGDINAVYAEMVINRMCTHRDE